MSTWFLSFSTSTSPLGIMLVDAPTLKAALKMITRAAIHPGGEVVGVKIPDDLMEIEDPKEREWYRTAPRMRLLRLHELDGTLFVISREDHLPEDAILVPEAQAGAL